MKNKIYFIAMVFISAILNGCTKEARLDHLDPQAPAPAQVTTVNVFPNEGGAKLTYKIPDDPSFSYLKAVYEIRPGVFRQAKASSFTDTIALVGFGDTLSHEVKLYSVGKNEKESAPLSVTIKPLTPSVVSAFAQIELVETFGGVQVNFKNSAKADLSIEVIVDNGLNTWSPVTTFYTKADEGKFSARGFDVKQRRFGVYIRDRWNNKSDTLIKTLSPILEVSIPKTTWKHLILPTDNYKGAEPIFYVARLWDNVINGYGGMFASSNGSDMPQWFTIDLGKKVVISRIREHQTENQLYGSGAVKKFELWGSNNPDTDGDFKNWELLGTFESFKPSGLPLGQTSAEDKNYGWFLGEEFSFDVIPPAVRYIRFKTLETYSSTGQVTISELDLYGQIQP